MFTKIWPGAPGCDPDSPCCLLFSTHRSQADPRPSLGCVKGMEATLVVACACGKKIKYDFNLSRKDADLQNSYP